LRKLKKFVKNPNSSLPQTPIQEICQKPQSQIKEKTPKIRNKQKQFSRLPKRNENGEDGREMNSPKE